MPTSRLADSLDATVFDCPMGRDVESSLASALEAGVAFADGDTPFLLFRAAVTEAVREIESHPRGRLLQRLVSADPREPSTCPTAQETMAAVDFVRCQVVNKFQGRIAEMLALRPCLELVKSLKKSQLLPNDAELFAGHSVSALQAALARHDQAADMHILVRRRTTPRIIVAGVAEIKSYCCSAQRIERQLAKHVSRAALGLCVRGSEHDAGDVRIGAGSKHRPVRITVVPSNWKLPRIISWRDRTLQIDEPIPPTESDVTERINDDTWRITMRWSREALAADAYELTFWYMSKVGELAFAAGSPWPNMTPAEAGRNAIKDELYHVAKLRKLTRAQRQRATALYNIYGFGYALGNHFRSEKTGFREMLFPGDLDAIASTGRAIRDRGRFNESFRIC